MPRMAARAFARPISTRAPRRAAARRAVVVVTSLVVALAGALLPGPALGATTDQETVFAPAAEGRTLSRGPAGWMATTQVTAVGCGVLGCPTLTADWQPGIGRDGGDDGALRARLSGLSGQSGVAAVVWRSPVVLTPAAADAAWLGSAVRRVQGGEDEGVASRISLRLVPVGGGVTRTAVEGATIAPTDGSWTSGPQGPFPAGALPLAALHRIEVELEFRFDSRSEGSVALDIDDAGLTALVPRTTAHPPSAPAAPAAERERPVDQTQQPTTPAAQPPAATATTVSTALPGAALATCRDDELVVLAATASGGRLTVTGGSSRPAGTRVSVQSADGWRLGAATVGRDGYFRLTAREPSAGGPVRRVAARFDDGEASATVAVQRNHVLRRVVSAAGRQLVVEGTLSARPGSTIASVRLERVVGGPCGRFQPLATASVKVDRRTGRYRALVTPPAEPRSQAPERAQTLFRARVTTRGPRLPRRVTSSQIILGAASGIAVD